MRQPQQRPQDRTPRRRRRAGSYPLQLIGAATVVIFVLFLLVLVIEKVARPYWLGHQGDQQVAELRARLVAQRWRNAELRAKAAYLRSPEGGEATARRHGYRRPGEEVFVIAQPGSTTAVPPAPPANGGGVP
jgi:cell division protein FtsB